MGRNKRAWLRLRLKCRDANNIAEGAYEEERPSQWIEAICLSLRRRSLRTGRYSWCLERGGIENDGGRILSDYASG